MDTGLNSRMSKKGWKPFKTWQLILLNRFYRILPMLMMILSFPVTGDEVGVFGPVQLIRGSGSPVAETHTVTVTNPAAAYRLLIGSTNGSIGGPVSSGSIHWNGKEVAGPSQFKKKSTSLSIPVNTLLVNTLSVELQGKPGNSLTVQLVRCNQSPVAHAGDDRTLAVGDLAILDGSASTDADGDALSYRWRLLETPANSAAQFSDGAAVRPELPIDRFGHYQAELIVSDGFADSAPDRVVIDTRNSAPVAHAGEDQSAFVGASVLLDGGLSHDNDGDILSYQWHLDEKPASSNAVLADERQQVAQIVIDKPGRYVARLTVNDGQLDSEPDLIAIDTLNSAPVADAGEDRTVDAGTPVHLDGSLSYDIDGDAIDYVWSLLSKPEGSETDLQNADSVEPLLTPDVPGLYVSQLKVTDPDQASSTDTQVVTALAPPINHSPVIDSEPVTSAVAGQSYRYSVHATDPDGDPLSYRLNGAPEGMTINAAGVIDWMPSAAGLYPVIVSVIDGRGGDASQSFTVTVAEPQDSGLPPDPLTVAPASSPTASFTPLHQAAEFLYSGDRPVQTGVGEGVIEARRIAVIRGKVLSRDKQPLSGVTLTVKEYPEFGQTLSRADGQFDLAVNGGGTLTLNYQKSGFLPIQRRIDAPWQEYALAEEAVMIPLDSQVTEIDLSSANAQVAQGSVSSDVDGQRQATILFPANTQATLTRADGTHQILTHLHVRATEYTVGPNGPKTLPGPLPPTSGYTYAVELSVDEAQATGAAQVTFNQALPVYVDNFLGFPVGETVPAGWYDFQKAAWIPSDNGKVIQILAIANGSAALDSNGDNAADTAAQLTALGITAAEQVQLAGLYPAGKTLWRVPVTHFTPWDFNWPWGLPHGATPPPNQKPKPGDQNKPDNCQTQAANAEKPGCIIDGINQTLGEDLALAGTPHALHYRSDRMPGNHSGHTVSIPLSEATVPETLKRIDLVVHVAGREFKQSFAPAPNLSHTFAWDGKNAYGQTVNTGQTAQIRVGYVYSPVYYSSRDDFTASFGISSDSTGGTGPGGLVISASRPSQEITQWKNWKEELGSFENKASSLGGWSLSQHHVYDPGTRTLYRGDGSRIQADNLGSVVTTIAGTGVAGYSGDGGQAINARINGLSQGLVIDSQGRIIFADEYNHRVRRIDTDGLISTIAGTGRIGFSGDGGPGTLANLKNPHELCLGLDDSIHIVDWGNNRVRRLASNGIISTVAGNGTAGFSGDGGPATSAMLNGPYACTVAPDGTLYIAEFGGHRIRRIDPKGVISTFAGTGTSGYSGEGGPATQANLDHPTTVIYHEGSVYFSTSGRVLRVGADGLMIRVAGIGGGYSGDGSPAALAQLNSGDLAFKGDGSLVIADAGNNRLRIVTPDGIINTLAGTGAINGSGNGAFNGDGLNPLQTTLNYSRNLAIGADQALYFSDTYNYRIRKITPPLPGFTTSELVIPSQEGGEVYRFDAAGHHIETRSTITDAVTYRFAYDGQGLLQSVSDGDGNETRIERDRLGHPTAIVAPDGQRTNLELDANGFLAKVINPANESHAMAYSADGLLIRFTTPENHSNDYEYDSLGRLSQDTDPVGGGWLLNRTELAQGFVVTMTSGEGRISQYQVEPRPTGDRRLSSIRPDGTVQTLLYKTNGEQSVIGADGTVTTTQTGPDPRFGLQAPLPVSSTVTTPSGLSATVTQQRTVSLADANDPFSLTSLTDTISINGKASVLNYHAQTKTWTATSAENRVSSVQINEQGKPLLSTLADIEPVAYEYDDRGRLSAVRQGQGEAQRKKAYSYYDHTDAASGALTGYLESSTDALGRSEHFAYDEAGRIASQVLPDNRVIQYQYDANGNLTGIRPPERDEHLFNHNAVDRVERYTPPDAPGIAQTYTEYFYNKDQQPTRIQRPDSQTIDFVYQLQSGKLDAVHTQDGDIQYHYLSASGQLDSLTWPDGDSLSYRYDGGLVTGQSWTGTVHGQVDFGYDSDFRVISIGLNQADSVAYGYDQDGLITQAGELSLTRQPQNGLLSGTALGTVSDSISYNGFGETSDYQATVNGVPLIRWTYQRDRLGRIIQKTETSGGISHRLDYRYDDRGRLEQITDNDAVVAVYGYDANGNRTQLNGQTVAVYDSQDRLTDFNGKHYVYTDNGELQSQTENGQTTTYGYDVFGNLRHVDLPDGTRIDYVIDGQHRRIGKKVNGQLVQAWLYQSQLNPVAELDGDGQVITRFVYGDKGNVPSYLVKTDPATQAKTTYRLISDHLGSSRLVVDAATGAIVQELDYDVWGNLVRDSNPGFQPFGFAGGLYDRDTHLVRFGARDYDAETGRWTAKDPIGFAGGDTNLYGYVLNDPVNFIDPMGEALEGPGTRSTGPTGDPVSGPYTPKATTGEKLANRTLSKIIESMSKKIMKIDPETGRIVPNPIGFCIFALIVSHEETQGYRRASLRRACCVVNRQLTGVALVLRGRILASTSRRRLSVSGIRCDKHMFDKTASSISAMFSQLPCLGV